jgi:hypothetical protein
MGFETAQNWKDGAVPRASTQRGRMRIQRDENEHAGFRHASS